MKKTNKKIFCFTKNQKKNYKTVFVLLNYEKNNKFYSLTCRKQTGFRLQRNKKLTHRDPFITKRKNQKTCYAAQGRSLEQLTIPLFKL